MNGVCTELGTKERRTGKKSEKALGILVVVWETIGWQGVGD